MIIYEYKYEWREDALGYVQCWGVKTKRVFIHDNSVLDVSIVYICLNVDSLEREQDYNRYWVQSVW